LQIPASEASEAGIRFDLRYLALGVYIIELRTDQGIYRERIIKK